MVAKWKNECAGGGCREEGEEVWRTCVSESLCGVVWQLHGGGNARTATQWVDGHFYLRWARKEDGTSG